MSEKDYDVEFGAYNEDAAQVACVRQTGACCCIFLGLVLFVTIVSYIPVSGVTEAPAYARTFLYMSLGYHFDDVQAMLNDISPPPPSF